MKENGDIISWRCEPSPQSNNTTLPLILIATQGSERSRDGTLAPVPAKRISTISITQLLEFSILFGFFLELTVMILAKMRRSGAFRFQCEF